MFQYPEGPNVPNYPVSIESVIAIPSNDFSDIEDRQNYLMPEMTDQTGDYAKQCAKDYWQIDTNPGKNRQKYLDYTILINAIKFHTISFCT